MSFRRTSSGSASNLGVATIQQSLSVLVLALVAALAIWVIADPIAGANLGFSDGNDNMPGDIGPVEVTIVTLLTGVVGWGVLRLLGRFTARAQAIWTVIAVVFLLFSLVPTFDAASAGATVALLAMHLTVGGIYIVSWGLTPFRRRPL